MSQAAQESDAYAPGTQKLNIEGEVLRWHVHNDTAERVPAAAYIEMLEREVAVLKRQVRLLHLPGNSLLRSCRELTNVWYRRLQHQKRESVPQQTIRCCHT